MMEIIFLCLVRPIPPYFSFFNQASLAIFGDFYTLTSKSPYPFFLNANCRGITLGVKNPPASAGDIKRCGFDPSVGKIPWRRAWQHTPVILPAESHGQRSLVNYSLQGHKELDMTEAN